MKNRNNTKKGFLVLAVAVCIFIVSFIFASLINRMRNEALLTNKVSVNERLNQLASAIGRISIRKLQRDIELIDLDDGHGKAIVDAIMKGNSITKPTDYTSVVNKMPVIQDLKSKFKEKWGSQGELSTFKVEYEIHLKDPIPVGLDGTKTSSLDRRGRTKITVTTGLKFGGSRAYTVEKDFVLSRLVATPFCRYTLFSHKGADIPDKIANNRKFDADGVLQGDKPPLVCINQRLNKNNRTERDYTTNPTNVIKNADSFIKNGWIYLGGNGQSTDMHKKHGKLLLNIVPGNGDDELETKFGEFFHFYFNSRNAGWLTIDNWSEKLDNLINESYSETPDLGSRPSNKKAQISFVDYGLYDGLLNIQFAKGILDDYFLFKDKVANSYKATTGSNDSAYSLENGLSSSMHLFGTPRQCTPTLIFGKVQRRYLRAFGLYYSDISRVFPIRALNGPNGFVDELGKFYSEIQDWYEKKSNGSNDASFSGCIGLALSKFMKIDNGVDPSISYDYFLNGRKDLDLCGLSPRIIDEEPYMNALINMCEPTNPSSAKMIPNDFCSEPSDLADTELYDFGENDARKKEALFNGRLKDIKIDYKKGNYLKGVTTYTLTAPPKDNSTGQMQPGTLKISEDAFINSHFFETARSSLFGPKKEYFMLNQVIRINGDLLIDKELCCGQGGIIICSGTVTIDAPIINRYIEEGHDGDNPNDFGFLTIIARDGIHIKKGAACDDYKAPLPKLEAFLIAGCGTGYSGNSQITVEQPMRIIGGVAADDITPLVDKGSIIEWGFDAKELDSLESKEFCGLTVGPRDIEIYTQGD